MNLLLEVDDLLAPSNLLEALNNTFTAHRQAVCALENRDKEEFEADPTARICVRPGLI